MSVKFFSAGDGLTAAAKVVRLALTEINFHAFQIVIGSRPIEGTEDGGTAREGGLFLLRWMDGRTSARATRFASRSGGGQAALLVEG